MKQLVGGKTCSEAAISPWITGKPRPLTEALFATAKASGVSIDSPSTGKLYGVASAC
jgi:hypothetical protein